jgi:hypothetical protein
MLASKLIRRCVTIMVLAIIGAMVFQYGRTGDATKDLSIDSFGSIELGMALYQVEENLGPGVFAYRRNGSKTVACEGVIGEIGDKSVGGYCYWWCKDDLTALVVFGEDGRVVYARLTGNWPAKHQPWQTITQPFGW